MLDVEIRDSIIQYLYTLNEEDRTELLTELSQVDYLCKTHSTDDDKNISDERFAIGRFCPVCGCTHIVRNGHRKDGKQRFVCKDCGKSFVSTTNTVMENSHKDLNTWKKYIRCMVNTKSVRDSAKYCGLSVKTSFIWRHKILDSLESMANSVYLTGIVEADETFFEISYKGNHTKGDFVLPRKAHKRGKDHEYKYSKNEDGSYTREEIKKKKGLARDTQVCVPCAISRNGYSISKVSNVGKVSKKAIDVVYANRIKTDSILCTDKELSYPPFAREQGLEHIRLENKTKKGIYHINTVNSYHSGLKKFIEDDLDGVATKYLNNYLKWFAILRYAKGTDIDKQKDILTSLLQTQFHETNYDVRNKPPIPVLIA